MFFPNKGPHSQCLRPWHCDAWKRKQLCSSQSSDCLASRQRKLAKNFWKKGAIQNSGWHFLEPPVIHGHTSSYIIIHHHTSSSIYPNLRKNKLGPNSTNGGHQSELHVASKSSKFSPFKTPGSQHAWRHLEASIINLGPASCTWRPSSHGTISNNGTNGQEPCRYSMAHGDLSKMESGNASGFFFFRENVHMISRCKMKRFWMLFGEVEKGIFFNVLPAGFIEPM